MYVNGEPTTVRVEPVYTPTGEIDSFRPVTSGDSDRLEELTGVTVISSEGTVAGTESNSSLDGSSIMLNEAKGPRLDPESDKEVEDAIGETEREAVTSIGTIIDVVPNGTREQAEEDFEDMDLSEVRSYSTDRGELRTGILPDGNRVTVRPSADGRPTIEITELDANGRPIRGRSREIRYGQNN